jgi:3-oxoacyl-[acyl-carrier-protein] synthase-3
VSAAVGILGTGSYVPATVLANRALVERGLRTTDDWIVAHTGIRERRIAAPNEATSDMASEASRRALAAAGLRPADIDLILCATSTPDHALPHTAALIQERLGAMCGAMDLNAGCSGFAYALWTAFKLASGDRPQRILVVGADTYSRLVDWTDRTSAVFFGDGAGAAVVGPTSAAWMRSWANGADGCGAEYIKVPAGGSRQQATEEAIRRGETFFRMQGRAVWDFAVKRVPEAISAALDGAGWTVEEIDLLIAHQANERLLEQIRIRLGLPPDKIFLNIARFGNTAAASLGIALDEAIRLGRLRPGHRFVVAGFGAGLAWCTLCLQWPGGAPDPSLAVEEA